MTNDIQPIAGHDPLLALSGSTVEVRTPRRRRAHPALHLSTKTSLRQLGITLHNALKSSIHADWMIANINTDRPSSGFSTSA